MIAEAAAGLYLSEGTIVAAIVCFMLCYCARQISKGRGE